MAAYVIGENTEIRDQQAFDEYLKLVGPTVERYGGKYIARGGRVETLEGDWKPSGVVMIEFDSFEQAKRWYDSEEYHGPKELRLGASSANIVLVEGASQ